MMENREMAMRVACMLKMMTAFGVTDKERIQAMVEMTSGIPWRIPEFRGNEDAGEFLFSRAVVKAGLSKTFGAPTPADVMEAAISIGGNSRSEQGHTSPRQWVRDCFRRPPEESLGLSAGTFGEMKLIEGKTE